MRLSRISIRNYRSLRDINVDLNDLNLFIGANASGKSAILDALRFLSEAIRARSFRFPVYSRGGILNMAWKGQDASEIEFTAVLDGPRTFEWVVRLVRDSRQDFIVVESIRDITQGNPPSQLLEANAGQGWWWSREESRGVELLQEPTNCALAAASADATFPAREVAEFVSRWGFFDPSPFLLRRDWSLPDVDSLDVYGRNLGETLYALPTETLNKVVDATRSIVGVPTKIEPRMSEDQERFYFVQSETGLRHTVHQMGVSSGTLRMLALMTALYGQRGTALIGIEEPENYIHPTALHAFAQHIEATKDHLQVMITTHSPLMLDLLDEPTAVVIVKRDDLFGTQIQTESNPDGVRKALDASGFGLGQYHETRGFGA
jgi:predicted ATPase